MDINNNFNLIFTRINVDISFSIQTPFETSPQKKNIECETSNLIVPSSNTRITGFCKHKYSKSIQAIFVFNCPKAFAIFEKNGEIFAHSVNLPQTNVHNHFCFIQGFAKFTYPESLNSYNAKGCIFLINQLTLVFCKLAYADYDQLKIKEDYNCFDFRSPIPFLSIIFHDKVIDKFEILEFKQKKLMILSVYRMMNDKDGVNEQRKYELLLLDSE